VVGASTGTVAFAAVHTGSRCGLFINQSFFEQWVGKDRIGGCASASSGTRVRAALFLEIMTEKQHPPARPGDQALYKQWRAALERVIGASMARDATMVGTPERKAAQRECDAALAAFRDIADQIR
jgi:hypothetical protein